MCAAYRVFDLFWDSLTVVIGVALLVLMLAGKG